MGKGQHVLLTGPPGIGKTTLIRKVVDELLRRKLEVSGFYTEEVRDLSIGKRTGFQVVTLEGQRGTLASIQLSQAVLISLNCSKSTLKVGNYGVEISDFETLAIPTISTGQGNIIVIDEIGKMELFSGKFKSAVEKAFSQPDSVVLATIPVPKGKPIQFVEKIRAMPGSKLFTIDRINRDSISTELIKALLGE